MTLLRALVGLSLTALAAGCASGPPSPSSEPAPTGSIPSASAGASASVSTPSPESPSAPVAVDDRTMAFRIATTFETARASGDWRTTWTLLAPRERLRLGSVDRFAAAERDYNGAGGSRFEMREPERDAALYFGFVAGGRERLATQADVTRAYAVFADHPDIPSASLSARGYLVAPLREGGWGVWIVR
jgi:hypothetical protein